jgi:hypothetical protein
MKMTWKIIKKETRKVHSVKQVSTLLANDEKLKDPTDGDSAFNNFCITVAEKLTFNK